MTCLKYVRSKLCRAFTMTEGAIVLGVTGIVLGAVWLAASEVSDGAKVSQSADQVMMIANNYRALYTGRTPPNTISETELVNRGIVPKDMATLTAGNNYSIKNQWGAGVSVSYNSGSGEFTITYQITNVNNAQAIKYKDDCVEFATRYTYDSNGRNGLPTGVVVSGYPVSSITPAGISSRVENGCSSIGFVFKL